jgi:hypothetical protein
MSLWVQAAIRPEEDEGQEEERTAFVKNIPTSVGPAELNKLFAQDGKGGLVDVRLMKDRLTGFPRVRPLPAGQHNIRSPGLALSTSLCVNTCSSSFANGQEWEKPPG